MMEKHYKKKLVSVIIPTFNRADILEASVRTVMDQTYDNLEILIVDDKSTDDTESLVKKLSSEDPRVRYILNDGEKGAGGARNKGIAEATGEYIAFEDSDDYYVRDKLKKQIAILEERTDCSFCYSRFRKYIGEGMYYLVPKAEMTAEYLSGDIIQQLMMDNVVGCPTLVVRHDFLDETGGFDTRFHAMEDYDLAIRLGEKGAAAFADEVLVESPATDGSLSTDPMKYLSASLLLVLKYKDLYIRTGTLNHRMEIILTDAQEVGVLDQIVPILENIVSIRGTWQP